MTFLLSNKSKEFATTLQNALNHSDASITVVGIQAPTGAGKTTVMVNVFRERSRTLMIMPTQFACQQWLTERRSTDKMLMMNGSRAVEYFIRHQGLHHIHTVILDEAHVDSREYYAIRKILRMAKNHNPHLRLYFVSATLPIVFFQESFPELHVLSFDDYRPYKIDIHYEPHKQGNFFDRRAMIDLATKRLTDLSSSVHRVLIFTPTHDECEDMAQRIDKARKKMEFSPVSIMASCVVLVLHGGLEPEEREEVKKKLRTLSSYILIATNIAESSVTIPDLDVVIDSGLECRVVNSNYTMVRRASKMSLIQRAGRAGRTKNGTVFRLFSEQVFQGLEEFSSEVHDMDPLALQCLLHKANAVKMLGDSVQCNLTFLETINISIHTPKNKLMFLQSCGLRMIAGSLLWNLTQASSTMSRQETMWIALLIVIIEQYDKKPLNWVYYPRDKSTGDSAMERLKIFMEKVRYEKDMLVTIARFLLSILCYGKAWRDAATSISLNQKNVREFVLDWNRVFRHLRPLFPLEAESGPVDQLLQTLGFEKFPPPPDKKSMVKVVNLEASVVRRGRQFLIAQPLLYGPKLYHRFYTAPPEYQWVDNVIKEYDLDNEDYYYRFESRYFDCVYDHSWILCHSVNRSLGYDPRFSQFPPKAIHPIRLRGMPYGSLLLWTNLPDDLRDWHTHLMTEGMTIWEAHQAEKKTAREKKDAVMKDIREHVAFMCPSENSEMDPECRFSGGYLWKQAEEDFLHLQDMM